MRIRVMKLNVDYSNLYSCEKYGTRNYLNLKFKYIATKLILGDDLVLRRFPRILKREAKNEVLPVLVVIRCMTTLLISVEQFCIETVLKNIIGAASFKTAKFLCKFLVLSKQSLLSFLVTMSFFKTFKFFLKNLMCWCSAC